MCVDSSGCPESLIPVLGLCLASDDSAQQLPPLLLEDVACCMKKGAQGLCYASAQILQRKGHDSYKGKRFRHPHLLLILDLLLSSFPSPGSLI